jgi:hypothetical protein
MIIPTETTVLQTAAMATTGNSTWDPVKRRDEISDSTRSSIADTVIGSSSCFDLSDERSETSFDGEESRGPLVSSSSRPILKKIESSRGMDKSVRFESVSIRSYQQTLGDNPGVSYGPPISLDWDYEEHQNIDIDEYEFKRGFQRRTMRQMVVSYYLRKSILTREYGFSEDELVKAKKEADMIKIKRGVTNYFGIPMMKVETAIQSAGRKAKRIVKRKC